MRTPRASLVGSLAADPGFEGYPAGSIILCGECWRPVYALERGIGIGDRAGRAAEAFRPLRPADLVALQARPDLDTTWRLLLGRFAASAEAETLYQAERPRSGSEAICPLCAGWYIKVRTEELADTLDRAYVFEMVTVPPFATALPNRWIGTTPRWVGAEDDAAVQRLVDTATKREVMQ